MNQAGRLVEFGAAPVDVDITTASANDLTG